MDALDVVIVLLALFCLFVGFRRGVSWVGPTLVSLLLGIVVGAIAAPRLARGVSGNLGMQASIATAVFFAIVLLIEGLGTAIGFRFRLRALRTRYEIADSVLGAALSLVGVLTTAWFVGIIFSQSQWPVVDDEIQHSAIVRTLDAFAPHPPALIAQIQHIVGASNWPNPFEALAGTPPSMAIPSQQSAATPQIAHDQGFVVKVVSASATCQSLEAGSGWPVEQHYIVTNAHVVAGGDEIAVFAPDGSKHLATVVAFDPNVDVALLYVSDLNLAPLPVSNSDPASGTLGAGIGYPGGGTEQTVPVAVRGTEMARGADIYSTGEVTRDIEVLAATVVPGDSGGVVVRQDGTVIGMVFAASTSDSQEGYALTLADIHPVIDPALGSTQAVSTANPDPSGPSCAS